MNQLDIYSINSDDIGFAFTRDVVDMDSNIGFSPGCPTRFFPCSRARTFLKHPGLSELSTAIAYSKLLINTALESQPVPASLAIFSDNLNNNRPKTDTTPLPRKEDDESTTGSVSC